MQEHSSQTERIRQKLVQAKEKDTSLKVFGANYHKYTVEKPLNSENILAFEKKYRITLPACYAAFLTQVGNGGVIHKNYGNSNSAAGPYYGIYALEKNVDELVDDPQKYLSGEVLIYPDMSDEYWNTLNARIFSDEDLSDEEYDQERGRIYGGILPIGSQGCTYLHGIVLNGPHKGRVVNLDADSQKPHFTFEAHFLDWYERWLDEVISGELIQDKPTDFGFRMGGQADQLFQTYQEATQYNIKEDALDGLLAKSHIDSTTISKIEEEAYKKDVGLKLALIQLLCKHDYAKAKPLLEEVGQTDLLSLYQFIFWYAEAHSTEWISFAKHNMHRITDTRTLDFCGYLFQSAQEEIDPYLVPLTKHSDEALRSAALMGLGRSKQASRHVPLLAQALNDPSFRVAQAAVRALGGENDSALTDAYRDLLQRLPAEEKELKAMLLTRLNPEQKELVKKKWFQFWK